MQSDSDKEQREKDNLSKLNQLQEIFSNFENHLIPKFEKTFYRAKTHSNIEIADDNSLEIAAGNLVISMMDMIYKSAIKTFCGLVHDACYEYNMLTEEEFAKIKHIYDKWTTITNTQTIDDQLFEDFKNDLEEFTVANPDFFDDGGTFVWLFEEKVWNLYFKQSATKARELCAELQNIVDSKEGKMDFLIRSGYCTISPFQFEELIEKLFIKMGYSTELTPKTCDYGIDVIARNGKDIIAIQAKKYSKGNNVGNRDVQRLLGAMQLSTVQANKAILITSSDFTVQAMEQAKETPIELWDGNYISDLFKKYSV